MSKKKENEAPADIPEVPENTEPVAAEDALPEEQMSPEEFKEFVEKLAQEAAEAAGLRDRYLRLAAEYDNFRKRSAKERETLYTDIKADTVLKLLPVYDNLERAAAAPSTDEAYKKGVAMVKAQLDEILEKLGVTEIAAQGEPFDPNLHDAVMHAEDDSLGPNTVAEVFQKGFIIGEKVIRHSIVKTVN